MYTKYTISWNFIVVMFWLVAIIGWIANIVKLLNMDEGVSTEFILRIVGVIVGPFGAFMGLFF